RVRHNGAGCDGVGVGKAFPSHWAGVQIQGAVGYGGSGRPGRREEFVTLRSEAAWTLRRRLDPNWVPDPRAPHVTGPPFHIPAGPWWPPMRGELVILRYDLSGKKTGVVDKEDLQTPLGRCAGVWE